MSYGYNTLNIPVSEGDTIFFYAMNLVPPKATRRSVHLGTWHYSLTSTDTWHESIGTGHYSLTGTCHTLITSTQ